MNTWRTYTSAELAAAFDAEYQALQVHNTASERAISRIYGKIILDAPAEYVIKLAHVLLFKYMHRWQAYELIAGHQGAYHSLDAAQLERLGHGIDSWWATDAFARTLSGPLWRDGLVQDEVIVRWVRFTDLWWRRAALVSTVAFNVRSQGGKGDVARTLPHAGS
jgi:hypothetical protein